MRPPIRILLTILSTLGLAIGYTTAAPPADSATPVKGASISGTVYSASGAAISRATVTAYALPGLRAGWSTSPHEWYRVASVTTGRGGTYSIAGLAAGYYRIGVVPANLTTDSFGYRLDDGYADATSDGANVSPTIYWADDVRAPSTGKDVHLAVPVAITGHVTDFASGRPLAGIDVRAYNVGQWEAMFPSTLTDINGNYALRGVPVTNQPDPVPDEPGNQAQRYGMVMVDTLGWYMSIWWIDEINTGVPASIVDVTDPSSLSYDKAMTRSSRVSVTAVDTARRPVGGLEVLVDSAFPYPVFVTNTKGQAFVPMGGPGETGTRTVGLRDPLGQYRTTWYGEAPAIAVARTFEFGPDNDTPVKITVRKDAATVIGTVAYATGGAAPPTNVQARLPGSTDPWTSLMSSTAMHRNGQFELRGLWPGTPAQIVLQAEPAGEIDASLVTPTSGTNYVGTQRLPARAVNGWASDNEGQPAAGVHVDLWLMGDEGRPEWVDFPGAHAVTDGEGNFGTLYIPWTPDDSGEMFVSFTDPRSTDPGDPDPRQYAGEWYYNVPYTDPAELDQTTLDAISIVTDDNPYDSQGFQVDAQLDPVPSWTASGFAFASADGRSLQDIQVDLYTVDGDALVPVDGSVSTAHASTDANGSYKVSLPFEPPSGQLVLRFSDQANGEFRDVFFNQGGNVPTDPEPTASQVTPVSDLDPWDATGARVDVWLDNLP